MASNNRDNSSTSSPKAEVDTFEGAVEAGYFGYAPGADNDHSLQAAANAQPGDVPEGEPQGADNGASSTSKRRRK